MGYSEIQDFDFVLVDYIHGFEDHIFFYASTANGAINFLIFGNDHNGTLGAWRGGPGLGYYNQSEGSIRVVKLLDGWDIFNHG